MDRFPSTFDDRDASPGLLLWRVTMAWQARQRAALSPHRLTHVQFVLLAGLVDLGRPVSQSELAKTMGVDPMMTSQVLRALESHEFVSRRRGSNDARIMQVEATPAGVRVASGALKDVEATDHDFFEALGSDEAAMVDLLRRLLPGDSEGRSSSGE